jgi:hypothetical protein
VFTRIYEKHSVASNMLPILKQKARKLLVYRSMIWLFVAEADKISNLKLIEDLDKILFSIESEVFGA